VKYELFNKFMPADQVALMNLWMELGIPFKESKELFGLPLIIIGIEADPNAMTFMLPQSKHIQLLTKIKKFGGLISAPLIPAGIWSFWRNLVE